MVGWGASPFLSPYTSQDEVALRWPSSSLTWPEGKGRPGETHTGAEKGVVEGER